MLSEDWSTPPPAEGEAPTKDQPRANLANDGDADKPPTSGCALGTLMISLGGEDRVHIKKVVSATWPQIVAFFKREPPQTDDKASAGWYSFAHFQPAYRDSENFQYRDGLTLDYDHVTPEQMQQVFGAIRLQEYAAFAYTTWSHTEEKPRWRVLLRKRPKPTVLTLRV